MGIENHRIVLDSSVQKAGHKLLDHQCWVLGRDILSPWGNLLCEFGFKPVRCPNGGLTQYELHHALADDSHVYLWGFGAFFGNEKEGIFSRGMTSIPDRLSEESNSIPESIRLSD
jgi:hypothetical protein